TSEPSTPTSSSGASPICLSTLSIASSRPERARRRSAHEPQLHEAHRAGLLALRLVEHARPVGRLLEAGVEEREAVAALGHEAERRPHVLPPPPRRGLDLQPPSPAPPYAVGRVSPADRVRDLAVVDHEEAAARRLGHDRVLNEALLERCGVALGQAPP